MAQVRCTGDRALLDVAIELADHLVATFGPAGGATSTGTPWSRWRWSSSTGRPATGRTSTWPGYFVEARGHGLHAAPRPGAHATSPTGCRCASRRRWRGTRCAPSTWPRAPPTWPSRPATPALLDALSRQFGHMLATKTYVTGGLGSRWEREAFGDPYELPPDRAYAETCAAIGGVQWAWRMLLATGEPVYADAMERMLLQRLPRRRVAGGGEYFYVNPLQRARRRARRREPQPGARPAGLVRLRLLPAQRHAHPGQPRRLPGDHRRRTASSCTCTRTGTVDAGRATIRLTRGHRLPVGRPGPGAGGARRRSASGRCRCGCRPGPAAPRSPWVGRAGRGRRRVRTRGPRPGGPATCVALDPADARAAHRPRTNGSTRCAAAWPSSAARSSTPSSRRTSRGRPRRRPPGRRTAQPAAEHRPDLLGGVTTVSARRTGRPARGRRLAVPHGVGRADVGRADRRRPAADRHRGAVLRLGQPGRRPHAGLAAAGEDRGRAVMACHGMTWCGPAVRIRQRVGPGRGRWCRWPA